MGHYTSFELEIIRDSEMAREILEKKDSITIPGRYELNLGRLIAGNYDEMKWYDWREDMKMLSQEWPNVLFALSGDGEEHDLWKAWFRNGRMAEAEARIVYDEPDLDKVLPLDVNIEKQYTARKKKELEDTIQELKVRLATLEKAKDETWLSKE